LTQDVHANSHQSRTTRAVSGNAQIRPGRFKIQADAKPLGSDKVPTTTITEEDSVDKFITIDTDNAIIRVSRERFNRAGMSDGNFRLLHRDLATIATALSYELKLTFIVEVVK